jgi:hypothetical protein
MGTSRTTVNLLKTSDDHSELAFEQFLIGDIIMKQGKLDARRNTQL